MHRDITEHRSLVLVVWRRLQGAPKSMREHRLVKLAVSVGYSEGFRHGYREGRDDASTRWIDTQQRKRLR